MQDIWIKIGAALRSMVDLSNTWKGFGLSIATKIRLYRSFIQPIALLDCETWTLIAAVEKNYIRNCRIEKHTGSAQILQDTQRRNPQKSMMHEHSSIASLCYTTEMALTST